MNKRFEEILKTIPLYISITNLLTMQEYLWDSTTRDKDGRAKFLGKQEVINEEIANILEEVLRWVDNGMPGIEETREYITKLRNNEISFEED